jgi:hypothetical protein
MHYKMRNNACFNEICYSLLIKKIKILFRYWGYSARHGESGQGQLNPNPGPGGTERDTEELGQQSLQHAKGQKSPQSGMGKSKNQGRSPPK